MEEHHLVYIYKEAVTDIHTVVRYYRYRLHGLTAALLLALFVGHIIIYYFVSTSYNGFKLSEMASSFSVGGNQTWEGWGDGCDSLIG